jgi:hypothetical protein
LAISCYPVKRQTYPKGDSNAASSNSETNIYGGVMDGTDVIMKALDSKAVEKVYEDALSPGFKELGKVGSDLAKTARLLLAPFQIAASFQDRLERFLRELNERVPEERRVEVAAEISGPALDSMRYIEETSALWDLFKEILFKASDKEGAMLVHPSFVHIIKQLTRDEAFILFKLKDGDFKVVDQQDLNANNQFVNHRELSSTIPKAELLCPEAWDIYYAHLESLSLISWPVTKQTPILEQGRQTANKRDSVVSLTNFGKLFVAACTPPNP